MRAEVDFDRRVPQRAQRAADYLAQCVGLAAKLVGNFRIGDGDVPQRIEMFDRHLQLLAEKLDHVGKADRSAAQKGANRSAAGLVLPIKGDRAGDFSVKTGHRAADDFGDLRFGGIFGLRIVSAQAHEPLLNL